MVLAAGIALLLQSLSFILRSKCRGAHIMPWLGGTGGEYDQFVCLPGEAMNFFHGIRDHRRVEFTVKEESLFPRPDAVGAGGGDGFLDGAESGRQGFFFLRAAGSGKSSGRHYKLIRYEGGRKGPPLQGFWFKTMMG